MGSIRTPPQLGISSAKNDMTEAGKIPKYRSGILIETNNTESDTRQKSRFLPLSNRSIIR